MYPTPSYYAARPNPRDKYLAALAEVKAAEAEYLAAERLQQEEDELRRRLDQIQALKQPAYRPQPQYDAYPPQHYQQAVDVDALRRQIAAEERERILREQEAERRHKQELKELEARHRAQTLERERALAAQEAKLAELTRRAQRQPPQDDFVRLLKTLQTAAQPTRNNYDQLFPGLAKFAATEQQARVAPKPAPKPKDVVAPQVVYNLDELFPGPAKLSERRAVPKPAENVVSVEDLIGRLFGLQVAPKQAPATVPKAEQPVASSSKPAPTQAPAKPTPSPAKPTPAPEQPVGFGLEHVFEHFLSNPAHQTFLNALSGQQPQTEASSFKSTETKLKADLEARLRSQQTKEDSDLAEAIRMSLADLDNSNTTNADAKGKAPAPGPVNDITTSAAEIKAIDAAFSALANKWSVPEQLDFSTSRSTSPVRGSAATEADSVMARLTYSAHNQPVRYYHQALSKLLARLDAVESFGDEEVRHARKEAVGKVEGALEEVESVVEARWRKFVVWEREQVGAESKVVEDVPVDNEPVVVDAPAAVAEDTTTTPDVSAPIVEEPVFPAASAFLPEQSTETIRPYDIDADVTPRPASPEPEVDTFLLPAEPVEEPTKSGSKKVKAGAEEEVGSDWSEVDA